MSNVPITQGTGASSVATETVGGIDFQKIEVYGGGGASILTISPDGSIKASIIGVPTVSLSGSPSISGAVTIVGTATVSGTVGASVIGTVPIVQSGTITASIVSTVPSSVLVGASIYGQLPSGTATLGSIAALQGTVPWIISSVYGNIAGSVVGFQGGAWTTSVVGNVGVIGTPSISGTVISSIQGNVNIASVIGAVSPYAQPGAFVSGAPSVITGTASVLVLAAPSAPNRNYVTHILATNDAAVDTVINIVDNGNVIYTGFAAKSGGGFSATLPVPLKQPTSVLALYAQTPTQASVLVSMSGYTAT